MDRNTFLQFIAGKIQHMFKDQLGLSVAIDGIDASGKTTLADELANLLRVQGISIIRASIDGFHNPKEIRSQQGSLSPEGYYEDSYNYEMLKSLLLEPLKKNGSRHYSTAIFDFKTNVASDKKLEIAPPGAVLIFDGIFLQRPEIINYWDVKIFLDIPFELALERALVRDVALFGSPETVQTRYSQRYIPGQKIYFEKCHPKENADIVIDNQDPSNPTILVCHI